MLIAKTKALIARHALGAMLFIASAVFAACGGDRPATAVPESLTPVRQVRVIPAAERETARLVSASGTLAAEEQIILGTKVIGRLGEISVDLGSRVRKGQAIARIDQSDYRLRVDQAEAALQQARVRLGLQPTGKQRQSQHRTDGNGAPGGRRCSKKPSSPMTGWWSCGSEN